MNTPPDILQRLLHISSLDPMKSQHSYEELLRMKNSSFIPAKRISFSSMDHDELLRLIDTICLKQGIPLVIEDVISKEDSESLFCLDWLLYHFRDMEITVRNMSTKKDETGWTIRRYIDHLRDDPNEERYYGKDLPCPEDWVCHINKHLPSRLLYKKENDLISNLPRSIQPDNLMIYIGGNKTFTPSHTDICASIGHNVMVHAEGESSALWFLVSTHDKQKVNTWSKHHMYFQRTVDLDNILFSPEELAMAPFPVYIIDQRMGDFVIVPPDSVHQVINRGSGASVKIAWNRCTAQTLSYCLDNVLPIYKRIMKPEIYRNKAIVDYSIQNFLKDCQSESPENIHFVLDDISLLIDLYEKMIIHETIYHPQFSESLISTSEDTVPHLRVCDFCSGDIWLRWLHCETNDCLYDLCLDCYSNGRRCCHSSSLKFYQFFPLSTCIDRYEKAIDSYNSLIDGLNKEEKSQIINEPSLPSAATLCFELYLRIQSKIRVNCHQCATKKKDPITIECSQCDNHYCCECLFKYYDEDMYSLLRKGKWICKQCSSICNCSACGSFHPRNIIYSKWLTLPYQIFIDNPYSRGNYIDCEILNWISTNVLDGSLNIDFYNQKLTIHNDRPKTLISKERKLHLAQYASDPRRISFSKRVESFWKPKSIYQQEKLKECLMKKYSEIHHNQDYTIDESITGEKRKDLPSFHRRKSVNDSSQNTEPPNKRPRFSPVKSRTIAKPEFFSFLKQFDLNLTFEICHEKRMIPRSFRFSRLNFENLHEVLDFLFVSHQFIKYELKTPEILRIFRKETNSLFSLRNATKGFHPNIQEFFKDSTQ